MIRQRTRQKQGQIKKQQKPLKIRQQQYQTINSQQNNQLNAKNRLTDLNNHKKISKQKQKIPIEDLNKQKLTPRAYKTQTTYSVTKKNVQTKNNDFFDIKSNKIQTIKKDKDKQMPRKIIQKDIKKSVLTKQFQLHHQQSQKQQSFIKKLQDQNIQQCGNGKIILNMGWIYKGQYVNKLFHGHGQLYCQNKLIYTGSFQYGYFHGYGKLRNCQDFKYLISSKSISAIINRKNRNIYEDSSLQDDDNQQLNSSKWQVYSGQFKKGIVDGFGQVKLSSGATLMTKWSNGKPNMQKFILHRK